MKLVEWSGLEHLFQARPWGGKKEGEGSWIDGWIDLDDDEDEDEEEFVFG